MSEQKQLGKEDAKPWTCGKCGRESKHFIEVDEIYQDPWTDNKLPIWFDPENRYERYWCLKCIVTEARK